jgi:hypothetical protein
MGIRAGEKPAESQGRDAEAEAATFVQPTGRRVSMCSYPLIAVSY